MKNKKILFLSLGLLLVVTTLVVSIAAWLTDTVATDDTTFTIGDISYTLGGDFIEDGIIVPGQELIDGDPVVPFTLTNNSTVTSELRVRVEVKLNETDFTDLNSIFTTNGFSGGNFVFATGWIKDDLNNHWYYKGADLNTPIIPASNQKITLLSTLKLDGSKVGNSYSMGTINIKFTFEAKQSDYVTWEELTTINFSTGLAA